MVTSSNRRLSSYASFPSVSFKTMYRWLYRMQLYPAGVTMLHHNGKRQQHQIDADNLLLGRPFITAQKRLIQGQHLGIGKPKPWFHHAAKVELASPHLSNVRPIGTRQLPCLTVRQQRWIVRWHDCNNSCSLVHFIHWRSIGERSLRRTPAFPERLAFRYILPIPLRRGNEEVTIMRTAYCANSTQKDWFCDDIRCTTHHSITCDQSAPTQMFALALSSGCIYSKVVALEFTIHR